MLVFRHLAKHYNYAFLLGAALLTQSTVASRLQSRDIHVSAVITECEAKIGTHDFPTGNTRCQAVLGCILRGIGSYTAARWSAGASILAFIPTITAVMSNSIEEVMHIAEEDQILAVMLGLCSVTVFANRFGSSRQLDVQPVDTLFEHVMGRIERTNQAAATKPDGPHRKRKAMLYTAYGVLVLACFAVWFPTTIVLTNGVVVFSCPLRVHVPLWIGFTQAVVIANVVLRRFLFDRTVIEYRPLRIEQAGVSTQLFLNSAHHKVTLRVPKAGFVPKAMRGYTSTVTFALYAFATAVFGAMTMFTASDAVWCMVLFAVAAGLGRAVANFIIEDYLDCRQTIVVDAQARQLDELKRSIEQVIA